MPYFGGGTPAYYQRPNRTYGATDEQLQKGVTTTLGLREFNPLQTMLYGPLGATTDLVDTVASSVPGLSSAIGAERGDFNRMVTRSLDLPGLRDFYQQNAAGIEMASGVGVIIGSELIARKLTAPAGLLMAGLRSTPYLRRIAALDAQYAASLQTVRSVRESLAGRGLVGAQQLTGRATVETAMFDATTGAMATRFVTRTGRGADLRARGLGALKELRTTVAAEAVAATLANQNGFLYDDSMSYNMLIGGAVLGVGAGIGWIGTGYALRKIAQEDNITRRFAGALDPEGLEGARLTAFSRGLGIDSSLIDDTVDFLGGAYTDKVTQLGLEDQVLRNADLSLSDDAARLDSNRKALATEKLKQRRVELQKVTVKGLPSDGRVGFSMDAPGYGNHVDYMLRDDPMALNLVESIGGVADDMSGYDLINGFYKRIADDSTKVDTEISGIIKQLEEPEKPLTMKQHDKLHARLDKLQDRRRRLDFQSKLTGHVVIDGELVTPSMGATYERFTAPRIQPLRLDADKQFWSVADDALHGEGLMVGDNLDVVIPKGKLVEDIDYFDALALYRIADQAIDTLSRRADATIALPEKPTWFQLDMAETLLARTNGQASVMFPKGMTRESAQVESLLQKSQILKKRSDKMGPLSDPAEMHKLRVRLNLPKLSAYEVGLLGTEEHPVEFLLRGMTNHSEDTIRTMSLTDVKQAVAEARKLGDASTVTARDVKTLLGNSFQFMRVDGQDLKPLVMLTRPFKPNHWNTDALAERLAMRKAKTLQELTGPKADPLSREMAEAITGSPDFELASRPDEIVESQIQGSLLGLTPQSFGGALSKEVKPSSWNFRDAPGLLGAGRIRDLAGRIVRKRMQQVIEGAFGDSLKLLKNPRNTDSKLLLNQFHSFRGGWDIDPKPVPVPGKDGKQFFGFKLKDTPENERRWKALFNEDMPQEAMLQSPARQRIVLDEQALDLQTRFNKVTDAIIDMQNTLLRANGLGQIRKQLWYVPPPEVKGKHVGWVFGPNNKPVFAVSADTPEEFARAEESAMRRVRDEMPQNGLGYTFMTREQITDYMSLWDKAQMEWVSPSSTAALPGKRSTGGLTGADVRLDAFQESLQNLEVRFLNHGSDIVEALFKEQINGAKARADFARAVNPSKGGRFAPANYRTVHDYYIEALLGRSKSTHPGSIIGGTSRRVENVLDQGLEWAGGPANRAWMGAVDFLTRNVSYFDRSERAQQRFDKLASSLGEYMPFKSAVEMAEARERGTTPATMAKITGQINKVTAAITLRMLEVAHPIMNLSGIVNAMPSVVRQMTPRVGENREAFAKRVGHAAMMFDFPSGERIGVMDMTKLFNSALKKAWNRQSHGDYEFMMQRGYITQEVAEFQRQFGVIEAKGKYHEGLSKLVERASVLSDKSEDFSRSLGHFIGLELADITGVVGKERRHAFAHDVANKMIANYDPHDRAEIFQGAFGSMLGLFQSFAHNYYGRLFRYIETGDLKAFATQYAVQSALFGVSGVTGFDQVSGLVNWASGGERDMNTGIHTAWKGAEADFLANGLISQIPRIFGAEPVDLYSRGDTSVRVPGVGNTTVPGIQAMTKIVSGFVEGISAFWQENPGLTRTRIAEIMSNSVVNRPLAGFIETFLAGGNDTDAYGQLVSESKSTAEMVYRGLFGLRSQRQSMELEAFYSDKRAQEQQAAMKDRLRLRTRAAMREGRADLLPGIWEDYLKTGGDPRYFRSWIKRNYEAATTSRASRRLDDLLKNPDAFGQAMRFMDMGVGIEDDEAIASEVEQFAIERPVGGP